MGNWTQNPHWTPWRNLEQEKMLPTPKLFKSFSLHPKKGIVECGGNQIEHIRAKGSLCQHQSLPSLKDEETEAGGGWNDLPRVTQCWRPSWDQICPPQAHACPSSLDTASPRRKGFVFCLFLLQCLAHKNCRSMENPHVWGEMVLFPSQGVDNTQWTLGFQTLKHCCSWGVWKWIGQVSQMWRGKIYIFAWLFSPEVTKQESGGQNLVGCLASFLGSLQLRIPAFQHPSWIWFDTWILPSLLSLSGRETFS